MSGAHRLLAGLLAAGALLASGLVSGCAQSVDPIERLGRKAARQVTPGAGAPGPAARKRWGLAGPLATAPKPPAHRPSMPYVVNRVPTRQKVVFLAFDDGAERDREFLRMTGDLKLPVSMVRTAGRTDLRALSYEGQRAEICGRPRGRTWPHFRPPGGAYNADTLRAAADCGVRAVVLGREYAEGERLRPGDIVLAHRETTARLLHRIQEQGYAVARLEDYV
ncbi:polysaccharide deacetylase family protein [Streptomyces lunaelactis]|uniref:polysaccharide deacetylase family protein n=1 Tax=Streptomyces lunaelactis TaxID=1535768 RepID=UPI00158581EE|nr:polysaccharide deacetylase family protein [Streptomyces lunaelactis]NUK48944.1 polysaccharide deacetylase family protein [Streptomyces lunaelactis]NUK63013.1 polysaccharide deacetylase family protein [Streptomyces lunaelactis]